MESKIPFYNVINMLLIGIVFSSLIIPFYWLDMIEIHNKLSQMESELIISTCFLALAYEVGFIINRISSVIIEPLLRLCKIIHWCDYAEYVQAQKKDSFLVVLSREYALSRNTLTLFLMLSLIGCVNSCWIYVLAMLMLVILFLFSTRKHSIKICTRINIK